MDERTFLPLFFTTFFLTFLFFHNTNPPYTLTFKSNSCIIFTAALSPSQLLITSKHSSELVQGEPKAVLRPESVGSVVISDWGRQQRNS